MSYTVLENKSDMVRIKVEENPEHRQRVNDSKKKTICIVIKPNKGWHYDN